jgi:hypothetical protein
MLAVNVLNDLLTPVAEPRRLKHVAIVWYNKNSAVCDG